MGLMLRKLFLLLVLVVLLSACSSDASGSRTNFNDPLSNRTDETHKEGEVHRHLDPEDLTTQIQIVLVPSEVIQGPNRFAIGIFDQGGSMVHEGQVHLHYYDLNDPANPIFEMEADAHAIHTPDGNVTIFAHEREFNAGEYGVEVELTQPDGSAALNGIRFMVQPESASIEVGEQAPAVDTPTLASTGNDLSQLASAEKPNPAFYERSLAQAISSGKPTMLLFATPAFCQTRFCGPSYEIFNELHAKYGDKVNFIHVEVFTGLPNPNPNNLQPAPVMLSFGLESEPWVYLIGTDGKVLYRVEGVFTINELESNLQAKLDL